MSEWLAPLDCRSACSFASCACMSAWTCHRHAWAHCMDVSACMLFVLNAKMLLAGRTAIGSLAVYACALPMLLALALQHAAQHAVTCAATIHEHTRHRAFARS